MFLSLLLYIAPSDAPSNVSVVALSASLAHLTWQPLPLSHINGIITDYIIRIAGVDTIEQLVQEFHTQKTNLTIELDPFYTYNFAIAAHTIALGSFSAPIDLKMPEAGEISYNDRVNNKLILHLGWVLNKLEISPTVPSTPVHNVTVDVTSPMHLCYHLVDSSGPTGLEWHHYRLQYHI